jgi:hypothetical protein
MGEEFIVDSKGSSICVYYPPVAGDAGTSCKPRGHCVVIINDEKQSSVRLDWGLR